MHGKKYSAYNKKRFAAITIRVDAPKTTALLFSSGKLVITGANSKQMAIASVRSTVLMLNSIFPHLQISYTNHIVQNIVCNVSFRNLVTIDIQRLHKDFGTSCTFQPSIFPGFCVRACLSVTKNLRLAKKVFHLCQTHSTYEET